jgi:BirA family biotin operon repressor/biotin-[acetyl-CoA-carboxylase] ligase
MPLVYVSSPVGANQFQKTSVLPLHFLFLTPSTNTDAMQQLGGLPVGQWYACWTDHQTAGRGRQNRPWLSEPGASLCLSVGGVFSADTPLPSGLSVAIGVAVVNVLQDLGVKAGLKWPNDVVVADAKVAGILCEATYSGTLQRVVVGVGVNVKPLTSIQNNCAAYSLNTDHALPITSLTCHGVAIELNVLAQQLTRACAHVLQSVLVPMVNEVKNSFSAASSGAIAKPAEGLRVFLRQAQQLDIWSGQPIYVVDALGKTSEALALGIDESTGGYRVLTSTGEQLLSVGELRLRKKITKN